MNSELTQLNFNNLLILASSIPLDTYDFKAYLTTRRYNVKGYCLRCEEKSCNTCPTDASFKLQNISHGASTDDILLATKQNGPFADWHNEGVMFLMEGPSKDYGIYEEVLFNGHKKRPAKDWYWVHTEQKKFQRKFLKRKMSF